MDPSTPRAEQMQMVSDLLRVCKHGSALVVLNRAACMPCFEGLAGAVRMGRSPTRQLSLMLQEVSVLTRVPLDKLGVEQQPNIFMVSSPAKLCCCAAAAQGISSLRPMGCALTCCSCWVVRGMRPQRQAGPAS